MTHSAHGFLLRLALCTAYTEEFRFLQQQDLLQSHAYYPHVRTGFTGLANTNANYQKPIEMESWFLNGKQHASLIHD
jgi:hypothetical protein